MVSPTELCGSRSEKRSVEFTGEDFEVFEIGVFAVDIESDARHGKIDCDFVSWCFSHRAFI